MSAKMKTENIAITVKAPASKSVSHRILMAAALAKGQSIVENVLESQDLIQTMAVLSAAGAHFERIGEGKYKVSGALPQGSIDKDNPTSCDVHESGTSCRLLTAILATGQGYFRIHGAERMHERPIGTLTDILEELGTSFEFKNKNYPPFTLNAQGLNGGTININLEESSQYLSGLLLAAPLAKEAITIFICGRHVVSWPYIGLTLQIMKAMGARFDVSILDKKRSTPENPVWTPQDVRQITEIIPGEIRFRVRPFKENESYKAGNYFVEGDWSGASYLLAAGALGDKAVCVQGLNRNSVQADIALLNILEKMNAEITYGSVANPTITVHPSNLRGIEVNMADCPDIVPTVAVLASCAHGTTTIRGVEHLRIKECDRLHAMATELKKAGVTIEELQDGLIIQGLMKDAPISQAFIASLAKSSYGYPNPEEKKEAEKQSKKDSPNSEDSPETPKLEKSTEEIQEAKEQKEITLKETISDDFSQKEAKLFAEAPHPMLFEGKTFAFDSYGDHRIVMSLSLLELHGSKNYYDNPNVITKSFPEFWDIWKEIKTNQNR